jgi:DNA replication protein DnaC
MRDQLHALLAQLRFHGMAEALDAEIARAEREAAPASELLYRLLSQEAAHRRERSLAYRLKQAHLPWNWTLDTFPFDRQPGVSKAQIQSLAGLDFLRRADNVLLIGKPGTGKTGIASCAKPASTVIAAASTTPRFSSMSSMPRSPIAPPHGCSLNSVDWRRR